MFDPDNFEESGTRRGLIESLTISHVIIVAYRDESETEPQWITFTGTDKEEVRGRFEEFAILNHVYSAREVF
ncbi:hypothetical protein [Thiothrix sp.]|jgi:hypothetical protein|uniref:hypothetical protein n=1 Tax=Thiothrix sp. TaxID=1032 RepID=UPI002580952D|nr:hypothetical protein [Thiothrix sp.]